MTIAFLGLGSNLGDREAYLHRAACALEATKGIELVVLSSFRVTLPIAGPPQPDYVNAVLRCETSLSPQELLAAMMGIENQLGRVRTQPNGPRTIDLDLLMYDQLRVMEPDLQVPHPRLEQRRFVLEPLAELAPDLLLASGFTASQRLAQLLQA
jgi:2-amino-4-hydroxy-6-hydroxymethyldihydropteridine diphosphokinase